MVARRADGLPLEHVLGWAEFCGLRIAVGPACSCPVAAPSSWSARPWPCLAWAGSRARGRAAGARGPVLRLRRGGAALAGPACGEGPAELHAADIDPAAVACARRNVAAFGGTVYLGDLYEPLPAGLRGRVGLLTANVPYIPAGAIDTLPAEARVHEPRVALDGGADGLDILRRVASAAPRWLAPGGHLLVETSEEQAPRPARPSRGPG